MENLNTNETQGGADARDCVPRLVRRLGRFRIAREILLRRPEDIMPFLAECVVVEAQSRWDTDTVEYVAMSHRFDEIKEGFMAPEYDVSMRRRDDGKIEVAGVVRR